MASNPYRNANPVHLDHARRVLKSQPGISPGRVERLTRVTKHYVALLQKELLDG